VDRPGLPIITIDARTSIGSAPDMSMWNTLPSMIALTLQDTMEVGWHLSKRAVLIDCASRTIPRSGHGKDIKSYFFEGILKEIHLHRT
jgi:hypothetical protein